LERACEGLRSCARELERVEIKYELRTEILLGNYAESKLEALAGGASRYESIKDVLLAFVTDPSKPVRREHRRGMIVLANGNARVESALIIADLVPLFDMVTTQRVSVLHEGLRTEYSRFFRGTNRYEQAEGSLQTGTLDELGLPFSLLPKRLIQILAGLTNRVVDADTEHQDQRCLRVKGLSTDPRSPNEYVICLNPAADYVPVEIGIYSGGNKLSEFQFDYAKDSGSRIVPVRETVRAFSRGREIYRETWELLSVREPASDVEGMFVCQLPPGTLINEYRFGSTFAYRMGARPPTLQELTNMASSVQAIRNYELSSWTGPAQNPQSRVKRAVIVIGIVGSLGLMFILWRLRLGRLPIPGS